jgi:hypothetical protein
MNGFRNYEKQELFNQIDQIKIERIGDQIVTKYGNRVIKTANVSNRYEIFDISKYLKDKIESIEENFTIYKYSLTIKGGVQYLQLISDKVEIGGVEFYKSFYILNSSDKSRRLSFNVGLRSESNKFYMVGAQNCSLIKKHLTGVTQAAEEASRFDGESFNEQIENIQSLVGHQISFSKMREVILGDNIDTPKVNHRKLDAFKNSIRYATGGFTLNREQISFLCKYSENIDSVPQDLDFHMDAFWAFQMYLRIFNRHDSHVVKNETGRILNMTKWAVRNSVLESLGIY